MLKDRRKLALGFLAGGLGNQLFQLAALWAKAKLGGLHLVFIESACTPHHKTIDDLHHTYGMRLSAIPNTRLVTLPWGYYQSGDYFKDCRDDIVAMYDVLHPTMFDAETIAVHVRLGDYKLHPKVYASMSPEYLIQAVTGHIQRGAFPRVRVYSDEPEEATAFVRRTVGHLAKITTARPGTDVEQLRDLAGHRHIITANSSYSWWAAWLHHSKYADVTMPKLWYAPGYTAWEGDIYSGVTEGRLEVI